MDSLPDPIGDLLDLGGIAKTTKARSDLDKALETARGAYDFEHGRLKSAPANLLNSWTLASEGH
jgi:hypothetical protein